MIQDIGSSIFNIAFKDYSPAKDDHILRFNREGKILVAADEGRLIFPKGCSDEEQGRTVYLFSLNDTKYFLLFPEHEDETAENASEDPLAGSAGNSAGSSAKNSTEILYAHDGFTFKGVRELRGVCSNEDILIVFTAYHLWRWYADNRFCGRCGRPLSFKHNERALICPKCGNVVYPRINPAVIVGVTNGDKLLITRYKIGFAHNALVAGFTEIGETLEQTVAREVMEETGIRVKNIRYYKSQPWGMAQDVLTGFYSDVDGDTEIKMDDVELKFAEWIKREDIELQPNDLSLTNEMMKMFKEGKI